MWLSASLRPTVVVVLPSPAGVGVIAVTRISLPFGLALQRLDVVHRDLGLVVAVGLEVLRRDAELLARDLEDRPLLGGLRDLDVGFRMAVLRGGMRSLRGLALSIWSTRERAGARMSQVDKPALPGARAFGSWPANSPAAIFGPSARLHAQ